MSVKFYVVLYVVAMSLSCQFTKFMLFYKIKGPFSDYSGIFTDFGYFLLILLFLPKKFRLNLFLYNFQVFVPYFYFHVL